MLAVHWFNKRDVFVLSTIHNTGNVEVHHRGSDCSLLKPIAIYEHRKVMVGVDYFDQLLSSYSIERRSKKWWKKVFYYLIEVSVINAYVIFSSLNPQHKFNRLH